MKKMKLGAVLAAMVLALGLLAGCGADNTTTEDPAAQNETSGSEQSSTEQQEQPDADLLSGKHHIEISMKDFGLIKCELDADIAPITVTNFVNLASEGFYDGLTLHRIIPGFMIQGGDPLGNGTGGSGTDIKGEFSMNGVENTLSHTRGVISMARAQDPDSASSQFFIVHEDSTFLDGQYAAFGYVTEGMDVVDEICNETPVPDLNSGAVAPEDQPVIEWIKVID